MISPCVQRLRLAVELRGLPAEAGLTHEQPATKIGSTLAAVAIGTVTGGPILTEPRPRAAHHPNLLPHSPGTWQPRHARRGGHRITRSIRGTRWITKHTATGESPATAIALAAASRSPPCGGRSGSATPSSTAPARSWSSVPLRGRRSSHRSRPGGSNPRRSHASGLLMVSPKVPEPGEVRQPTVSSWKPTGELGDQPLSSGNQAESSASQPESSGNQPDKRDDPPLCRGHAVSPDGKGSDRKW